MIEFDIRWLSALTFLAYTLGVVSTYHVIMSHRSSQAAIAWSISLCSMPFIALPIYWVFGRTRFHGYVEALRGRFAQSRKFAEQALAELPNAVPDPADLLPDQQVIEKLASMPFSNFNQTELMTTGRETFDRIFAAMDAAESYILIQFYIYRDDGLGRELMDHVQAACRRGVQVYLLYDEIGCARVGKRYLRDLRATGASVSGFRTTRGPNNRFQLNFRNHRKIVVTDGHTGFVGGYNVGDEYLGHSDKFGLWRDTHCELKGPAVLALQYSFLSDWYWAQKTVPDELDWTPHRAPDRNEAVLVVSSGPADKMETWKMLMLQSIRQADDRFWLVSPYFVPDSDVVSALQLAALRGVDVRIMLPNRPDHRMVWLASFTFLDQMEMENIRFFRYTPGFLHQKVVLVDNELAIVGTANADNRSFRLNFEISITGIDPNFIRRVEAMLKDDFLHCREVGPEDYRDRPLLHRCASKVCRLMAPVL